MTGSARGGRITKADVLAAGNGGPAGRAAEAQPAGAQLIKGGGAALARYMDQSRQIPTATSFRTLTVTTLDARRKQLKNAGLKVSFTHLIAYAIARVATEEMPVMANHFEETDGKPYRLEDGAVNLGLAVDVEKKDGSRTLMVPVIRDAGRLGFKAFLAAYNALVDKARTNSLTADDLSGANLSLTNPGGIGTVASVPRLMVGQGTIVATGSIAYPVGLGQIGAIIGAEKVMTMTSTYDHRIIQGAESGRFLQRIEALLAGDERFYETVFADLGVELPELPPPPAPAAAAGVAAAAAPDAKAGPQPFDEDLLQAVQAATSLLKAHRTHGHLAAHLDPLGRESEGDPALDPTPLGLTPELMARIPAHILRMYVPGATLADALPHLRETYCGTIAYEIEHIASHRQRLWLREAIESGQFRSPLTHDEQKRAAQAADRGRRVRALHAQGLPGPEAVLGRGARHDRANDRRADPAGGQPGGAGSGHRHGPPRPAERAGSQPGPPLRDDLRRVRGFLDARADHHPAPGRHRRRQVPPRRPGLLPARRAGSRSSCAWSRTHRIWSSSRRWPLEPRGPRRPPARARTPTRTPTPRSR